MPTAEWLNKYESIKEKLSCKADLDAHFTEKVIGNREVAVLDIGAVHFPTGTIFACDPLVELVDTPPFTMNRRNLKRRSSSGQSWWNRIKSSRRTIPMPGGSSITTAVCSEPPGMP